MGDCSTAARWIGRLKPCTKLQLGRKASDDAGPNVLVKPGAQSATMRGEPAPDPFRHFCLAAESTFQGCRRSARDSLQQMIIKGNPTYRLQRATLFTHPQSRMALSAVLDC